MKFKYGIAAIFKGKNFEFYKTKRNKIRSNPNGMVQAITNVESSEVETGSVYSWGLGGSHLGH